MGQKSEFIWNNSFESAMRPFSNTYKWGKTVNLYGNNQSMESPDILHTHINKAKKVNLYGNERLKTCYYSILTHIRNLRIQHLYVFY